MFHSHQDLTMQQKLRSLSVPLVALAIVFLVYLFSDVFVKYGRNDQLAGRSTHAVLEKASESYLELAKAVENATSCVPLNVDRINRTTIQFLHCSEYAYVRDGQGTQLTDDFEVPTPLARQFNFWRRVYSLWSNDHYVVHSSHYPEVIFEIVDVSGYDGHLTEARRGQVARDLIRQRRREYQKLLNEMHRLGPQTEYTNPAMTRIARYTRHIEDNDKYRRMANSLRTQRGQMQFIESGLIASGRYLPAIKEEFRAQGIPEQLAYLAFIESSFNLRAYSKVGASGIYQIMPATGRQYMLVNDNIDERRDPIKSGRAAARLLRFYYGLVDEHWPLAVTAYNHGVGGVRRAVRTTGSTDIAHIVQNYNGRAFGFASKNFYTGFLGMLATIQEEDVIYPNLVKFEPLEYSTYKLKNATSINFMKKKFGLTNEVLTFYNPDLSLSFVRSNGHLPRNYELKYPIPEEQIAAHLVGSQVADND